MRFGLCYIPDYHAELHGSWRDHYESMLGQIELAEELGYDGAWFAEHRIPRFGFGNPALFIAAAAQRTSRIRLGSSIALLSLNDPLRVAEDYAMADVLSGGRLDFGVGRGFYKYDYDMANVEMADSKERFDEGLEIVLKAWTERDWSHAGRWKTVERHTLTPEPVQRPHPPVWFATIRTKESYTLAGRRGFNLMTAPFFFTDFAEQQERIALYHEGLREGGHDPSSREIFAVYHLYCGEDEEDVRAVAEPALARYQRFCFEADMKREGFRDPNAYGDWKGFLESRQTVTFDQMRETRAVIGTPEECAERVRMIAEAYGITYIGFEINYGGLPHDKAVESLERFAREVMPQLREQPVATAS